MNCPKCGNELDTGFNCHKCGYKRYEQQKSIQILNRRQVAAILVDNGYSVKKTTIKAGKYSKTALEIKSKEESL